MATIYVSQSTANGYSIGIDTNNGTSKSGTAPNGPVLTVTKGLSLVNNNDTLVINDGTYAEASFPTLNNSGLTINSETAYGAVVQSGASTRVFHVPNTAGGATFGKIVIDGANTRASAVTFDSGVAVSSVTFNGTKFINYTGQAVNCGQKVRALTMSGGWSMQTTVASGTVYGVVASPDAASTFTISGGSIAHNVGTGTHYSVSIIPTILGCTATIGSSSAHITDTSTASAAGSLYGVYAQAVTTLNVGYIDYATSGANNVSAVQVPNHATINCTSCKVHDLTGTLGGTQQYLIRVGDDTVVSANSIQGAQIWNNNIGGGNHGILVGYISGAAVWGNTIDNVVLGIVSKGSTAGNLIFGNKITRATDKYLYSKGSTNDIFTNNDVFITASYTGTAFFAGINVATNVVNAQFYNNIVYATTTIAVNGFANVDTAGTAVFAKNNYYSTVALPATSFTYQNTTYATVAAWQAAHETSSFTAQDPVFLTSTDYRLGKSSPCYRAGFDLGIPTKDFRGRPFNHPPSIGAYEVSSADMAVNARTMR